MKVIYNKYIDNDRLFYSVKQKVYSFASEYLSEKIPITKTKLFGIVIPKLLENGRVDESKIIHLLISETDSWENLASDVISIGKKEKIFAHKVESIFISSTLDTDKPFVFSDSSPFETVPDNSRIYLLKASFVKGKKLIDKVFVKKQKILNSC